MALSLEGTHMNKPGVKPPEATESEARPRTGSNVLQLTSTIFNRTVDPSGVVNVRSRIPGGCTPGYWRWSPSGTMNAMQRLCENAKKCVLGYREWPTTAFNPSIARWFSAGVPIVTRTHSGRP